MVLYFVLKEFKLETFFLKLYMYFLAINGYTYKFRKYTGFMGREKTLTSHHVKGWFFFQILYMNSSLLNKEILQVFQTSLVIPFQYFQYFDLKKNKQTYIHSKTDCFLINIFKLDHGSYRYLSCQFIYK